MAKKAIFLSLTRQLLFLIPSLLVLPHYFGTQGVWMSHARGGCYRDCRGGIHVKLAVETIKEILIEGSQVFKKIGSFVEE